MALPQCAGSRERRGAGAQRAGRTAAHRRDACRAARLDTRADGSDHERKCARRAATARRTRRRGARGVSGDRLLGLPPVIARTTRLVVLGSFPGAASLAARQYYAHPRNAFWPLLSALWGVDLTALPYARRLAVLRARGLGLWDVYASCRREGSLDTAIEDAQ
ncbi:MAG: DNA-deoxyinosine glycosylase, partial [Burkholderiaceae bacterium]|nr:DNA-deoxyinosine glycosylase [Burkholderiaceae bacterium]